MSFNQSLSKFALAAILFVLIGWLLAPFFAGVRSVDPVALHIGQFEIYWYGVTMALGILVSGWVSIRLVRSRLPLLTEDQLLSAMVWAIVGGLVGARLLFVALKWELYAGDIASIVNLHQGGMSIHGALLGGLIGIISYGYLQQIDWKKIADVLVVGLPLGQALGRFGNFFNQEAYGGPTNLPWKMFVSPEMRPDQFPDVAYFHPTFIYEAICLMGVFAALSYLVARHRFAGQLFMAYLALYSIVRFGIEFFRVDSDAWGIFSVAQWASIAILGWVIIWYYRTQKHG